MWVLYEKRDYFVYFEIQKKYNIVKYGIFIFRKRLMNMQRLKEIRLKRGITQQEIAAHLNVQQTTYSKYERGASRIDNETLKKICQYLNISADYLLGNTDVPLTMNEVKLIRDLQKNHTDEDLMNKYKMKLGDETISPEEIKVMLKIIRGLIGD